ncbi:hypothetical protein M408DRAFT_328040 [Serendipita vermifera MAFF 305830]|uniref:Uncharacterized protein n=1 Tax=Serendipita vermifera MAFF 305830 TaxID=933852 RepID=A0A0C2WWC7_SERVB|nr:hypothetical protein M408DRAFT_328040 [Serendipita vermifera MAFF 305830]
MSQVSNQNESSNVQSPVVASVPPPIVPLPMSFPALLVNPRNKAVHLQPSRDTQASKPTKVNTTLDGKTRGKRHIRRYDNVNFYGNPHIVQPGRADFQVPHADVKPTFPKPLPAYLPRVSPAPSGGVVLRSEPGNINSAYSGRFTLSLRGVRKDLRQRGGGLARSLVQDIESAIQSWLDATEISASEETSGRAIDHADSPVIQELSYKPLELVWITDDPFARWIIHCVSRWHGVVSFSKDVSIPGDGEHGPSIQRQTHLLRPNTRHPDPRAAAAIYTPTATDLESSIVDTEDSDYANLGDSISSLQIVDVPDMDASIASLGVIDSQIKEEAESYLSDAESTFSLVEHPTEVVGAGEPTNASEKDEVTGRSIRPTERVEGINFQPNLSRMMRSESSPSRSPIRTRRLRHVRRVVVPPRRSQGVFRTVDPPSSFMAYVYGA